MIENEERERYGQALKKASVSKAFDRILHILTFVVFLCGAAYVIYQQADYQADTRKVTAERNKQLQQLQVHQDRLLMSAESLKDYIGCLKALPIQPDLKDITACREEAKG